MKLRLLSVMQRFQALWRLANDRHGVTALEYGLIAAVMVTAIASTIRSLSAPITGAFCRAFEAVSGLAITGVCS